MSKQQFEGRSAAEAAIKACESLGLTRSELQYTIISDQGELLARKVVIETSNTPAAPKPPRQPAPAAESVSRDAGSEGEAPRPERAAPRNERLRAGGRTREPRRNAEGDEAPRAPRAPQERTERSERPERGERRPKGRGPAGDNEQAESARAPKEQREGRRRGNEPRGRQNDRGHQEGIDSLLTIKPKEGEAKRHAAVAPTSPRSTRALTVITELLGLMGVQADTVLVSENEAELHVHLYGADEMRLIGKKGEVLLALQFIVNRILSREEDEGDQVVVLDAGGYRERRQKALEELANTLAERCVQERKAVRLSPMSAHDRRIFHMVLKDIDTVGTRSEGDGMYRHLLIIPAEFC